MNCFADCISVSHSPKNYVHECMLDNFLDFVVWGHEHECLITPQPSSVGEFYISQPGSSVATALSEGEAKKKFVCEFFSNCQGTSDYLKFMATNFV